MLDCLPKSILLVCAIPGSAVVKAVAQIQARLTQNNFILPIISWSDVFICF